MKKTILYILTLLTICAITSCAVNPQEGADPAENTTASTPSQTNPSDDSEDPTDRVPDSSAAEDTKPQQAVPEETKSQPTMPPVGTDPGGFGPIF